MRCISCRAFGTCVSGADVLLHLKELVGQDHREGIFLAVYRTHLQRAIQRGQWHGDGVGLQGLEGFQVHRVGDDTQLEALEVLNLACANALAATRLMRAVRMVDVSGVL